MGFSRNLFFNSFPHLLVSSKVSLLYILLYIVQNISRIIVFQYVCLIDFYLFLSREKRKLYQFLNFVEYFIHSSIYYNFHSV